MTNFIGFQVANKEGLNVQGEEMDVSGLTSWQVMSPETAIEFSKSNKDFLLQPIYEGMIEEYELV